MKRVGLFVLLVFCLQCGAFDMESQPIVEPPPCPTLDERLSGLTALIESGELSGLKEAIEEDISPSVKTRLIAVIFDLMDMVDMDALGDVEGYLETLDEGLVQSLGDGLKSVVALGDSAYQAIGLVGTLMNDCTGKPLLQTLTVQLRDPIFRVDIQDMIDSDAGMMGIVQELGLDLTNPEGRVGFVTFMRALVAYVSRPDFQVAELTGADGILGVMATEETPTLQILIRILDRLLAAPSDLLAVQTVTGCWLAIDTDDRLLGLAFDILHAQAIAPEPVVLEISIDVSLETILDSLVLPALDRLVSDDALRQSLVVIVGAMLHPDVVSKVLPDVVALIDHGVLADIIDLFLEVGSGACHETSS